MPERVYHLVDPERWPKDGSPHAPESLQAEGFLHASFSHQLPGTLEHHYDPRHDDTPASLWLLELDETALSADLRVETSRGGADFPHLYRALHESEVLRWWNLERRGQSWTLPCLGEAAEEDEPEGAPGAP
jgi:uncharacterized protein (DUF952 family)